jgi:NhaC family Na+:H+ antiporter
MSLCTGTSWGSAGTVGVALMGMAAAIDAPLAAVAGAIVSGAYFGDKLSPLSDSTNICAIGAGADLYAHVRNMLYTAGPSFVVAGAAYFIVGMKAGGAAGATPESAERLIADIETLYNLNPMILLPLIIVIAGIAMKKPAALTIALSTVVALAIGVALQGFQFADAARAAVSGFSIEMASARGFDPAAFGDDLQRLVNRGGLYMMSDTLIVIIAAFLLAAGLEAAGAMETLLNALLGQSRSVFRLVGASMGAGALTIGLTSHGGVTAMVVGGLFQKPYRDRGLAPENLSRSLEDSVTIVEPLLPWTVSAIYMASTLGVSTVAYAPWAIFCFSGPVFSLLLAATFERTGFGLKRLVAANRH